MVSHRSASGLAALILSLLLTRVHAAAQEFGSTPTTGLETALARPPAIATPPLPPVTHLLGGGWAGEMAKLNNLGISVLVDDWSEYAANVSGGRRRAGDYAGQVGLEVDLDWDKIAGIPGLTTTFTAVQRSGRSLGTDALADNYYNPAQIYGGGGNVLVHVVYFFAKKVWLNERITLIAGRYAVGANYDSAPLQCLYMGLAICSQPRITTQTDGYASWPSTAWGAVLRLRPTSTTYIQPGIFETSPSKGGTAGTDWGGDHITGVTVPVEAGYEPLFGPQRLDGHYKIGFMWDSSYHYYTTIRANDALGGRHGQLMSWVAFDQMLWRNGPYNNSGFIVLGGYTHINGRTSPLSDQAYAGFQDVGQIKSRPFDAFGAAVTHFQYGTNVKAVYQPSIGAKDPLGGSLNELETLLSSHTNVLELVYSVHVLDGIDVAPEYQYICRPGGTSAVRNASILGVNMHITL